jgi:hypothetical protein
VNASILMSPQESVSHFGVFVKPCERIQQEKRGRAPVIDGGRYCRTLNEANSREACFDVLAKDTGFQFFDANCLMQFEAQAE